jgi:hypothetical protein
LALASAADRELSTILGAPGSTVFSTPDILLKDMINLWRHKVIMSMCLIGDAVVTPNASVTCDGFYMPNHVILVIAYEYGGIPKNKN